MRARQEHGVAFRAFFDLVRLTGEGRLVDFEIVALQNNAVCWQEVTIFNLIINIFMKPYRLWKWNATQALFSIFKGISYLNDVADYQLADLNLLCSSLANHIERLFALNSILQSSKLLLLRPIIEGRDENNNDDGNENGTALDPSVLVFLLLDKA